MLEKLIKANVDFNFNSARKGFGNKKRVYWATLYWNTGYLIFEGSSAKVVAAKIEKALKTQKTK